MDTIRDFIDLVATTSIMHKSTILPHRSARSVI